MEEIKRLQPVLTMFPLVETESWLKELILRDWKFSGRFLVKYYTHLYIISLTAGVVSLVQNVIK